MAGSGRRSMDDANVLACSFRPDASNHLIDSGTATIEMTPSTAGTNPIAASPRHPRDESSDAAEADATNAPTVANTTTHPDRTVRHFNGLCSTSRVTDGVAAPARPNPTPNRRTTKIIQSPS